MQIIFPLPIDQRIREINRRALQLELQIWSKRHNIDYTSIKSEYHRDSNSQQVTLPNDRALELFCFSWSPGNHDYKNFALRR